MVFKRHFQQYFSYILAISFIGGGNRRKPPTLQTSSHKLVLSTPRRDGMRGIQIHNFNFSGCTGSCKLTYQTMTSPFVSVTD